MNDQTLIALAGIGGTLIAGLGGTYLGARMERTAESRRDESAVRRAAVLIDVDLMFAENAARIGVEQKKWWVSTLRLTTDGWQQHRGVIATKLTWDNWVSVVVAVEAVGHLQDSRDRTTRIQVAQLSIDPETEGVIAAADRHGLDILDPSPPMSEAMAAQIEPMLRDIEAGRAALIPLTQEKPLGAQKTSA